MNKTRNTKKFRLIFILILTIALGAFVLPGCSVVKEGITGERQNSDDGTGADSDFADVPAAFPIIGNWFGVYGGNEYLALRFTADGKCELQPALYPSDVFGPRYYGEYIWGGDDGKEISVDLYKGVSREVNYGDGQVWDEWSDGGRDSATTALTMAFRVYGGDMKSVAMKAVSAGIDTEGYTVVQFGAFVTLLSVSAGGSGNPSPFIFGSQPYDQTEGKTLTPMQPDILNASAERFYTTAELNVRCGPSTSYGTYGTIPLGTQVNKIGSATGVNDWAFVLLVDGGGWVNTDYISANKPETAPEETKPEETTPEESPTDIPDLDDDSEDAE